MSGTDAVSRAVLDRDAVAALDASDQVSDILAMPGHLTDAMWRVETANLSRSNAQGGLVVAGMGGSAIGGALAAAILGDDATRPLLVARGYGVPAWTTPETAVLCASYSGNTEETLAAYEAAGALGARRIVTTTGGKLAELAREDGVPVIPLPGGFQPRAAVAYMTIIALEVAALVGLAQPVHTDTDVAADHLKSLVDGWGPDGPEDGLAKSLARSLHGQIPAIAGAGLTTPIAYRWKTQLHENAKVPCNFHELPELNHNEIVGWAGAKGLGSFAAVLLDDCDLHPRVRQRIALTAELVEPCVDSVHVVETRGESRLERLFSLVLLGDLVSLYLAILRGIDPSPVEVIESFKQRLA